MMAAPIDRARLSPARLSTVQVVPPSPFSPDGRELLSERLGPLCAQLYRAGVRVFLPAAGTGEFHSLSPDEIVECVRVTRAAVGADAVVVGPIGFGLGFALDVGRRALEAGADGLLVMPPAHPYLCDAGLGDYFRALADGLAAPLLAYKKGPAPSDELLLELCREGRLSGIKYAVNELDAVARFKRRLDPRAGLYCGTAERFAPYYMLAGATGYTSGIGSVCPRLTLAMHAALARGDQATALRLLDLMSPLEAMRSRSGDSYNISVIKEAVAAAGHDFGPTRPPQRRLSSAERDEVRTLLAPILSAEAELADA